MSEYYFSASLRIPPQPLGQMNVRPSALISPHGRDRSTPQGSADHGGKLLLVSKQVGLFHF